jgi:hypothetical protein
VSWGNTEHIRDLHVAGTGLRFQGLEHKVKLNLNLMVSADCEPTSASRTRRSSESSTMDCPDSKLNGTVFGTSDWPDRLRVLADIYTAELDAVRHSALPALSGAFLNQIALKLGNRRKQRREQVARAAPGRRSGVPTDAAVGRFLWRRRRFLAPVF